MEGLGLLEEPVEPAALEADVLELLDLAAAVGLGVVRELRALDELEEDRVLEALQHGADVVEREQRRGEVRREGVRHGGQRGCGGERDASECAAV